jgi:hypothetical protein
MLLPNPPFVNVNVSDVPAVPGNDHKPTWPATVVVNVDAVPLVVAVVVTGADMCTVMAPNVVEVGINRMVYVPVVGRVVSPMSQDDPQYVGLTSVVPSGLRMVTCALMLLPNPPPVNPKDRACPAVPAKVHTPSWPGAVVVNVDAVPLVVAVVVTGADM